MHMFLCVISHRYECIIMIHFSYNQRIGSGWYGWTGGFYHVRRASEGRQEAMLGGANIVQSTLIKLGSKTYT